MEKRTSKKLKLTNEQEDSTVLNSSGDSSITISDGESILDSNQTYQSPTHQPTTTTTTVSSSSPSSPVPTPNEISNDLINFNGFEQLLNLIENEESLNSDDEVKENNKDIEQMDDEEYNLSESEAILFSLKNNYVYNPVNNSNNNTTTTNDTYNFNNSINNNNFNNSNNNNNSFGNKSSFNGFNSNINNINNENKLETFLKRANEELEKNQVMLNYENKVLSLEKEVNQLRDKLESKENEISDLYGMINARNKFLNSIPRELLLNWIVSNKIVVDDNNQNTNHNSNI